MSSASSNPKIVLLEQYREQAAKGENAEVKRWSNLIHIMRDINRRCRLAGYNGDELTALFMQLALCCTSDDD